VHGRKRNRYAPSASDLYGDGLAPVHVGRSDRDLDMRWIQPRIGELRLDPLSDYGIVLAALASHSGSHRRRGALSDPHVDDVAKFKDPEQDRQQDEGNGQDRLKRFLPLLH